MEHYQNGRVRVVAGKLAEAGVSAETAGQILALTTGSRCTLTRFPKA
jgi:hypothetical protein